MAQRQLTLARPLAKLDWVFLGLCVIGIGISSYLTWTRFANTSIICTADASCDTVSHSAYAFFPPTWGIPVSILGLIGYIGLLGLGFWRWRMTVRPVAATGLTRGQLDMGLFIIALGGILFSAYLTAMELWVIHAICWWCVGSAVTMTLLFVIAVIRVWNID
jgi:uncharacterized membrane protein